MLCRRLHNLFRAAPVIVRIRTICAQVLCRCLHGQARQQRKVKNRFVQTSGNGSAFARELLKAIMHPWFRSAAAARLAATADSKASRTGDSALTLDI
jgi:hypothetical protein